MVVGKLFRKIYNLFFLVNLKEYNQHHFQPGSMWDSRMKFTQNVILNRKML